MVELNMLKNQTADNDARRILKFSLLKLKSSKLTYRWYWCLVYEGH